LIYEIYRRIKVPLRNANKRASKSRDKNVGYSGKRTRAGDVVVDKTSLRYDCFEGVSSWSLSTARSRALLIARTVVNAKNSPLVRRGRLVISNALY